MDVAGGAVLLKENSTLAVDVLGEGAVGIEADDQDRQQQTDQGCSQAPGDSMNPGLNIQPSISCSSVQFAPGVS